MKKLNHSHLAKSIPQSQARKNRLASHLYLPTPHHLLWRFLQGAQTTSPTAFCDIDDIMEVTPETGAISTPEQPDTILERKLAGERLSKEARYVMNLIFSGPSEALEAIITPIQQFPTKTRIARWLQRSGWSGEKVEAAFAELAEYTDSLE